MKLEESYSIKIEDEDEYSGKINDNIPHRLFNYSTNTWDNIDCYVNNSISRVDYQREFYDDDAKPSMLLNLDSHNKRRASIFDLNHDDEPPCKRSLFYDDEDEKVDSYRWKSKPVVEWDTTDTTNWLLFTGIELGHSYGHMSPAFAVPGRDLLHLTKPEFAFYDRIFGEKLYDLLHARHQNPKLDFLPSFDTLKSFSDDETSVGSGNNFSDGDSDPVKKRPIGRPRILDPKKKIVKVKLWEFIRNLLLNPKYCPVWICWEDYEKKRFRFVQSDSVAKLWGERKNNKHMTYEKFSRAMRYYYPKHIFEAVPGRRLVYEFGEKATGLETDNPNFDPNYFQSKARSRQ